jgi:hypothetical protein
MKYWRMRKSSVSTASLSNECVTTDPGLGAENALWTLTTEPVRGSAPSAFLMMWVLCDAVLPTYNLGNKSVCLQVILWLPWEPGSTQGNETCLLSSSLGLQTELNTLLLASWRSSSWLTKSLFLRNLRGSLPLYTKADPSVAFRIIYTNFTSFYTIFLNILFNIITVLTSWFPKRPHHFRP